VNVRRTDIGVVHRADTDEPNGGTGLRVVTPNRDPAGRAAGDFLALPARRWHQHNFWLAANVHDTIGFIERVERMRCSRLALTPTAVAGMNDQWRSNQPISDLPASASAFHIRLRRGGCRRVWARNNRCALLFRYPPPRNAASVCSFRHSRTKFLSIPLVFGAINALFKERGYEKKQRPGVGRHSAIARLVAISLALAWR
jgi:hypothetical protein